MNSSLSSHVFYSIGFHELGRKHVIAIDYDNAIKILKGQLNNINFRIKDTTFSVYDIPDEKALKYLYDNQLVNGYVMEVIEEGSRVSINLLDRSSVFERLMECYTNLSEEDKAKCLGTTNAIEQLVLKNCGRFAKVEGRYIEFRVEEDCDILNGLKDFISPLNDLLKVTGCSYTNHLDEDSITIRLTPQIVQKR